MQQLRAHRAELTSSTEQDSLLTVPRVVMKFPALCVARRSSKQLASCSYPDAAISSPRPNILFKIHFNITFPSMPRFSNWSLSFRLSIKTLSILHDTYPACRAYWSSAEQTDGSVQEKERKAERNKERNRERRRKKLREREGTRKEKRR